jgi:uroporphyrinogen III methyltransferase/synthase
MERKLPLSGVRVVITRPEDQAEPLDSLLHEAGADTAVIPLIRLTPAQDGRALVAAAACVEDYDWLVFTSANAVRSFAAALAEAGSGLASLVRPLIAVVGPATAAAAADLGTIPRLVSDEATGAALAAALLRQTELNGRRVLWPRARAARPILAAELKRAGAIVDEVEAYGTEGDEAGARRVRSLIDAQQTDVIVFASPSAVRSFVDCAGPDTGLVVIAAIGPVTAAACAQAGLPVHVEAGEHTAAGVVSALIEHFSTRDE